MTYKTDVEGAWVNFTIGDDYKWVLLVTMILIVHYFACVMQGGSPRGKLFTQEWMTENFGKEHEEAINASDASLGSPVIGKGGYPDCGSGRYTQKLGYEGWMNFNKSQRVHLNYMESIS